MSHALPKASLDELRHDRNWGRRLLTTPALFILALSSLVALPVVLPMAALWDLGTRNKWSASRTALFFSFFLCFEALGLLILFWLWLRHLAGMDDAAYEAANRRMQRWWVRGSFGAVTKLFSIRVDVTGRRHLDAQQPSVILSRHANTLDTLLPLALSDGPTQFRYVLKSELLFDPALDYCGQRFPNAFVRRGSSHPEREIAKVIALGQHLSPRDAVVLYPEGTRFSTAKRRRLLEKFGADEQMLPIVESLHHTLPPLREGSVRLLASTGGTDVVFLAHRGLEEATDMSDLITGALTGAHLEVAIWRVAADDVPRRPEGIRRFLVEHWRHIDRYVGGGDPPNLSDTKCHKKTPAIESRQPAPV